MDQIEFFSRQDIRYLGSLDHNLRRINKDRLSNKNVTESKWIFNRVMAHLLVNYFKSWFSISKEMIEKKDFWSAV